MLVVESGGSGCGDSLCKCSSCNSCRSAKVKCSPCGGGGVGGGDDVGGGGCGGGGKPYNFY